MKQFAIALLTVFTVLASCGKDEEVQPKTSRTLRYELTGNFSGSNIVAAYTTASGGTITEQIISIPWNKEITFDTSVRGASVVVSGAGGIAGQQATLVIKKGGIQLGIPTTATADAGGTFSISSPVITF